MPFQELRLSLFTDELLVDPMPLLSESQLEIGGRDTTGPFGLEPKYLSELVLKPGGTLSPEGLLNFTCSRGIG